MEPEVFRRKGGSWLGACRNWVKWHVLGGDSFIWTTNAKTTLVTTHGNLNLEDVEDIAAKAGFAVHEKVINGLKKNIKMRAEALSQPVSPKRIIVGEDRAVMEGEMRFCENLISQLEGDP